MEPSNIESTEPIYFGWGTQDEENQGVEGGAAHTNEVAGNILGTGGQPKVRKVSRIQFQPVPEEALSNRRNLNAGGGSLKRLPLPLFNVQRFQR